MKTYDETMAEVLELSKTIKNKSKRRRIINETMKRLKKKGLIN